MQTRSEIIDAIVAAYRAEVEKEASESYGNVDDGSVVAADAKEYERIIRSTLTGKLASLRTDEKVRTCEDFGDLGIACCNSCHTGYPHYELALIELESGGRAWICCALDRTLNPVHRQEMLNSSEYGDIDTFLGGASKR